MLTIEGNIVNPVRSPMPKGIGSSGEPELTSNGVNIDKTFRGRIEIGDDGLISLVGKETGQADLVLKHELIFPGFIDLHVHARECVDHSQDYKENFVTAGQAAINGGVVAFADMPNNPTAPVDDKSYDEKYQLTKKSQVDVLLYAGVGPKTNPLSKKVPYKVYVGKSVGDLFFTTREELEESIKKYHGRSISFHCEDPEILDANKNQPTHEKQRPPEAEIFAVDFALELMEKYELNGKICHCSTAESLQKILDAKKRGVKVTVEVTPHHLYFDTSMYHSDMGKWLQVNPPIRQSLENRLALIKALKKGDIDYLATDHAPHTITEKEKGASGLPHLDTFVPFVTWLMAEHGFTPADVARVCSLNPGNFINQFMENRYGKIEPDFVGSLSVVDMNQPIKIERPMLKTKCGWSPFEGIEFPGRVAMTIIKGQIYRPLLPL